MKTTTLLAITLFLFSCGTTEGNKIENNQEVTKQIEQPQSNTEVNSDIATYENTLDDFTKFCEYFKDKIYENDTVWLKNINKSVYKIDQLVFEPFKDTVDLVSRTPSKLDKSNNEMGEYEYNSYYKGFDEGSEFEFESGIMYYFNYNKEKKTFNLVGYMVAG